MCLFIVSVEWYLVYDDIGLDKVDDIVDMVVSMVCDYVFVDL